MENFQQRLDLHVEINVRVTLTRRTGISLFQYRAVSGLRLWVTGKGMGEGSGANETGRLAMTVNTGATIIPRLCACTMLHPLRVHL